MYSYDYWCHHYNSYWWVMIQTAQIMLIVCNTLFPRIFRFLHLERIQKANWVRWNEWSLQWRFFSQNLQKKFGCVTTYSWFAKWMLFSQINTFTGSPDQVRNCLILRCCWAGGRPEDPACSYNSQKAFCQNLVYFL